jgi:alkylhydroperoxidase family enzyme
VGVDEADLLAVRDWPDHEGFGDVERAVLAATDESLADGRISDRTWAACAEHLDEAALVELVVAIGNWTLFARLLPSLEVPLEDGVEPWPPDGRTPDDPTEET